ncbi:energy transducer TonB [Iodobacter sp.]|uniref:energy transducer TonB n=1 Tax=Iodobacter sp. TaxID=1915058 RepID=UPI0025E49DDE|nr:energy transducer TonB [Iodobacter sp.]
MHRILTLIALILFASLTSSVFAGTNLHDNEISKDNSTGSNIKKTRLWNGLPLNKRYHELSDDEKASLNRAYEKINLGDEPPYPQDGLRQIVEAVDQIAKKLHPTGKLQLLVDIDEQGKANNVSVLTSPNPQLAELVASVLLLSPFKPAICSGQPCKMQYPFNLVFEKKLR